MNTIEYQGKKYTISFIDNIEDFKFAVALKVDIIQFSDLDRKCGGFMYKVSTPYGYRFTSCRHVPYGGTSKYENCDIMKFAVCFYKAELHGIVNDILNNK